MVRLIVITVVLTLIGFVAPGKGSSLSTDAIVQLKQAGLSDATIQLIVR